MEKTKKQKQVAIDKAISEILQSKKPKPALIDKALSEILQVAASLAKNMIIEDMSEYKFSKSTPFKDRYKVFKEAQKHNELNKMRALNLKAAWDILSKNVRIKK